MVNDFYGKVRKDDLLGSIFNKILDGRWPEHLAKMYRFWQTILLDEHTYKGYPFEPHAKLPVEQMHFDRWVFLFSETVHNYFSGDKANRAIWQGERMAEMFLMRIDLIRERAMGF